ncbi:hypothetical protein QR680_005443 [Steinernema hermaphroditum]|uniref:NADH:ubiquinone oxidoreductase intermediate-associated protein 30 domain-containing protein n=1 Tax=Steinernema hermaphroditum TaxID=289476 RepID=A0AA39LVD0_9BILA|nr:hypothetical protein QR680_005443 [Steinernema hermaphroditum]
MNCGPYVKIAFRPLSRRLFSSSNTVVENHGKGSAVAKTSGSLEKKKWSVFGRSDVPVNINFPNEKGVSGYDIEAPMKEIVADAPALLKQNIKMAAGEIKDSFSLEKKEMIENAGGLMHNEARAEYRFDSDESMKIWHTGCDSVWNEGYSRCELTRSDRNTAIFKGYLSGALIRDGKVERAGWAAMKTEDRMSFNRKKYLSRWTSFSHLLIKCRGDGRSYKVMLYTPGAIDITWGDSFAYPLHTHGGPYWQYEKIPFSRFLHTVAGRIQDGQYPINQQNLSSIGIVLMDRIDGEFQLEIDYIGVYNDRSHEENFAYETYTLPVFSTHGI